MGVPLQSYAKLGAQSKINTYHYMIYNTTECHCIISNLLDVAANGLVAVDVDNLDTWKEKRLGVSYWRGALARGKIKLQNSIEQSI